MKLPRIIPSAAAITIAVAALAVLAAGGFLVSQHPGTPQAGKSSPVTSRGSSLVTSHSLPRPPASAAAAPGGWSLIAMVKHAIPRYPAPGTHPDGTIPARWYGAVSALPVIRARPGWYKVRLATRPNGSTAWVRSAGVTIRSTPYQVVVDLATMHIKLLRAGKVVLDAPAGIGTAQDPTPAGQFFLAFFEQAPSPGYRPFIIVTSAHSTAISDWDGSGDALIGIHGPLGSDGAIGSSGARLSHGCIRLHAADLLQLRNVPAGTPLTITA